jgi:protein SCO1/2/putative membrane protein
MCRFRGLFLMIAALAFSISSCSAPADNDTLYYEVGAGPVPDFTLTERNGTVMRRDDLLGKVWVVNFFFTNCQGDCPKTTGSMARLQERLAGWRDVTLVSLTVYPMQDTPERLRAYAADWKADAERWLFLTGPEDAVYELVQKGFAQSVTKNPISKPGYEIDHTFTLMVVDHRGRIRGYVDGRLPDEVDRLEVRVKELVQAKYLPTINASLNAGCALLLMLGYASVKRRWIRTHQVLMLSALVVSVVFLAAYLYYHVAITHGQPTRFSGEGTARSVYLVVLVSHTVLAAIVAPLALTTTYLGLTDRVHRHVRLARWTLPLWLYVSVTGVVVYWMLYHLYPPA